MFRGSCDSRKRPKQYFLAFFRGVVNKPRPRSCFPDFIRIPGSNVQKEVLWSCGDVFTVSSKHYVDYARYQLVRAAFRADNNFVLSTRQRGQPGVGKSMTKAKSYFMQRSSPRGGHEKVNYVYLYSPEIQRNGGSPLNAGGDSYRTLQRRIRNR